MTKVYPGIFHKDANQYWVEFPDLDGCMTFGETLEETMEHAQEAVGLFLATILEDGADLPEATELSKIKTKAKDVVSYVSVDVDKYRRNTKAVKKTLSIPEWLAKEAEKRNLSLSKVLQDGIKAQLEL